MAVHKLILDDSYDDEDYTLIAIHSNIEDYRLAYLLNKQLSTYLTRKKTDFCFGAGKSSYPIFEWVDDKNQITWNLVSNSCKVEMFKPEITNSLFDIEEKITKKTYLVPEHKAVNYFLKIDNQFNISKEKHILQNILKIQHVVTAFSIDINNLKSKDNLIFS